MASKATVTLTLPDGTRRFYHAPTRAAAIAKRERDRILIASGSMLREDASFKEIAEMWYTTVVDDKTHHVRTKETTRGILDRYVIPFFGKTPVRDIKPINIRQLMMSVESKSHSTQSKVLQATRNVLELARENGLIEINPVTGNIKAKGATPKEVEPLTNEQLEALLKAVHGTRAYLFVLTLALAGLRKGEALGLMWNDIDFEKNVMHIQRSIVYPVHNRKGEINEELKTAAANRFIPMDSKLRTALLLARKKATSVYVFPMSNGSYMSEASFRRMWDIIKYRTIGTDNGRDLAGRTLNFSVHPHQLRHTCVTNWIRNGLAIKEAQYLAGHASSDVTLDIYTHYQAEIELKETARRLEASRESLSVPV